MVFLRSEEHLAGWLGANGWQPGATMPAATLNELAQRWWWTRLDPDWRTRAPAASQKILDEIGLTGAFWQLSQIREGYPRKLVEPQDERQPALSTILVVDDEPNMRFLIRVTLEGAGYDVVEAHHGAVALERTKDSQPDLVVTDLMMPIMGGRELIDRLRSDPETTSIPILVLSANGSLRVGDADAALSKPFESDALLERVRTLSQEGRAE